LDEIENGEKTVLHELANFKRRRVEHECGVHHEHKSLVFGESAELFRFFCRLGGRFSDYDVLAVLERVPHELKMRFRRSDHRDALDIGSLP